MISDVEPIIERLKDVKHKILVLSGKGMILSVHIFSIFFSNFILISRKKLSSDTHHSSFTPQAAWAKARSRRSCHMR